MASTQIIKPEEINKYIESLNSITQSLQEISDSIKISRGIVSNKKPGASGTATISESIGPALKTPEIQKENTFKLGKIKQQLKNQYKRLTFGAEGVNYKKGNSNSLPLFGTVKKPSFDTLRKEVLKLAPRIFNTSYPGEFSYHSILRSLAFLYNKMKKNEEIKQGDYINKEQFEELQNSINQLSEKNESNFLQLFDYGAKEDFMKEYNEWMSKTKDGKTPLTTFYGSDILRLLEDSLLSWDELIYKGEKVLGTNIDNCNEDNVADILDASNPSIKEKYKKELIKDDTCILILSENSNPDLKIFPYIQIKSNTKIGRQILNEGQIPFTQKASVLPIRLYIIDLFMNDEIVEMSPNVIEYVKEKMPDVWNLSNTKKRLTPGYFSTMFKSKPKTPTPTIKVTDDAYLQNIYDLIRNYLIDSNIQPLTTNNLKIKIQKNSKRKNPIDKFVKEIDKLSKNGLQELLNFLETINTNIESEVQTKQLNSQLINEQIEIIKGLIRRKINEYDQSKKSKSFFSRGGKRKTQKKQGKNKYNVRKTYRKNLSDKKIRYR